MELDMTVGGVTYVMGVDIDDGYVCSVKWVEVCTGKHKFVPLELNDKELKEFCEFYYDYIQESYTDDQIARAEIAAEEKWESQNGR